MNWLKRGSETVTYSRYPYGGGSALRAVVASNCRTTQTIKRRTVVSSNDDIKFKYPARAELVKAMIAQPEPPCVNRGDGKHCEHWRQCATRRLSCKAFYRYIQEPAHSAGKELVWEAVERSPTRAMYNATYHKVVNKERGEN